MSRLKRPKSTKPRRKPVSLTAATDALGTIRERLLTLRARAYVCHAALSNQLADIDGDVALVLRRDIGDEIDRIQEELLEVGTELFKASGGPVRPRGLRS